VYERGGECVVGEFVLAYLNNLIKFTSIVQALAPDNYTKLLDFSKNRDVVYKLIP